MTVDVGTFKSAMPRILAGGRHDANARSEDSLEEMFYEKFTKSVCGGVLKWGMHKSPLVSILDGHP